MVTGCMYTRDQSYEYTMWVVCPQGQVLFTCIMYPFDWSIVHTQCPYWIGPFYKRCVPNRICHLYSIMYSQDWCLVHVQCPYWIGPSYKHCVPIGPVLCTCIVHPIGLVLSTYIMYPQNSYFLHTLCTHQIGPSCTHRIIGLVLSKNQSYGYTKHVQKTNPMGTQCMYKGPILWVHDACMYYIK